MIEGYKEKVVLSRVKREGGRERGDTGEDR